MTNKIECWKCDEKLDSDESNYCEKCYNKYGRGVAIGNFWGGLVVGIILLFLTLAVCGVFNYEYDRLDIDKDKLVSDYVKEYYPEFENCTIEYTNCIDDNGWTCYTGVNIYCNELDSRDSMKTLRGNPSEIIKFEDNLDLQDIFEMKLKEFNLT